MPNGSSSSSTFGSSANARARPTRWRMPCDSSAGRLCIASPRPDPLEVARHDRAALRRASLRASPPRRRASRCRTRSSTAAGTATGRRRRDPGRAPGSRGRRRSRRPPSAASSPAAIDSTVDLPQPEWPMRQTNSPLRDREVEVAHDHRLAAAGFGYTFVRCEISRYLSSLLTLPPRSRCGPGAGTALRRATAGRGHAAPPRRRPGPSRYSMT